MLLRDFRPPSGRARRLASGHLTTAGRLSRSTGHFDFRTLHFGRHARLSGLPRVWGDFAEEHPAGVGSTPSSSGTAASICRAGDSRAGTGDLQVLGQLAVLGAAGVRHAFHDPSIPDKLRLPARSYPSPGSIAIPADGGTKQTVDQMMEQGELGRDRPAAAGNGRWHYSPTLLPGDF